MLARRRTTSLALLAVLASLLLGLLSAAPASAAWKPALTWRGAVTQACRAPQSDGDVRVRVRLNNTRGSELSSGGLNRVRANGSEGDAWTYTRSTAPGAVSRAVFLDFARGAKVYLLIGSRVGITDWRTMKVADLPRC